MVKIFSRANFSLHKFVASDDRILRELHEEQKLFPSDHHEKRVTKVLGVDWDADEDQLFIGRDLQKPFSFKERKGYDTKKSLASMLASVYDPIHLSGPWKNGCVLLLQQVWKHHEKLAEEKKTTKQAKFLWDVPLPEDLQRKLDEWKQDYQLLGNLQIPRTLQDKGRKIISQRLAAFCDATPSIFAACVFMVTQYEKGPATSVFICARSRTNTNHSLPRAELMSARILATLVTNVREYLEKTEEELPCSYYSDSMISLFWLKQPPEKWRVFVSNQVRTIQAHSKPDHWKHIPGEINPADHLTRPVSVKKLLTMKSWKEGPEFLITGNEPKQPDFMDTPEGAKEEFKERPEEMQALLTLKVADDHPVAILERNCSDFLKILRVIALVKYRAFKKKGQETIFPTAQEMSGAMDEIARYLQGKNFRQQISLLQKGKEVPKGDCLESFSPFLDKQGLLRVGGRGGRAREEALPFAWRHPIILPSNEELLRKLVIYTHENNSHCGADTIHALLRQRFWILKSRATILRYRKGCVKCRRFDGKKFAPLEADLPPERLDVNSRPFTNIAIDGLGPLLVKEEGETKSTKKVWVLVISDMVTRGINLEVLHDLTVESFLASLRNHFADHGTPSVINCDNFRSHVKLSNLMDALFDRTFLTKVRKNLSGIKWHFSSAYLPSTNGICEIAVKACKMSILRSLGKSLLTSRELHTFLKEAKQTINSRPLTQVAHGDILEKNMPLSPNMLIYGANLTALPIGIEAITDKRCSVRKFWEAKQKHLEMFRRDFINTYVTKILPRNKWKSKGKEEVKVGDLVVVCEADPRRRNWPMAVVTEIISSKDNITRSVRIRMAEKEVIRNVRSLVFLRHLEEEETTKGKESDLGKPQKQETVSEPPKSVESSRQENERDQENDKEESEQSQKEVKEIKEGDDSLPEKFAQVRRSERLRKKRLCK